MARNATVDIAVDAPRARPDVDDAPSSSSEPPPRALARASTHRGDESTSREKAREQRWRRKRARDAPNARVDGRGRSKKTDKTYRYGNYDRYYGYRVGEAMEDHRLSALRDEWFGDDASSTSGVTTDCFRYLSSVRSSRARVCV